MSGPKEVFIRMRFDRSTKAAVDAYTDKLGLSVSGWLRMLVAKELEKAGIAVDDCTDEAA